MLATCLSRMQSLPHSMPGRVTNALVACGDLHMSSHPTPYSFRDARCAACASPSH